MLKTMLTENAYKEAQVPMSVVLSKAVRPYVEEGLPTPKHAKALFKNIWEAMKKEGVLEEPERKSWLGRAYESLREEVPSLQGLKEMFSPGIREEIPKVHR